MMPKKYIKLTEEEKKELEELVKHSANYRVRRRSQAILWSNEGEDRVKISELLAVLPDTVSRWFKNWGSKKLGGLEDLSKSGRPSKLQASEKKKL